MNNPLETLDLDVPVVEQVHIQEQVHVVEEEPEYEAEPLDLPVSYGVDIQEIIIEVAEEYGIEPSLMLAIAEIESNGNPNAKGKTNDYGLMQINKINHEWLEEELGITDWFDARQNAEAACYIVRWLQRNYEPCAEDTSCLLMAYNMGIGGARKLWNQGTYESRYSRKVLDVERNIRNAIDM